jgi:hypothetical protein
MATDVSEVCTASITRAMMEAVRRYKTSVYFSKTERRYILEGCPLQIKESFRMAAKQEVCEGVP